MKTIKLNESFICINCNTPVLPLNNGSSRNHCPFCLTSIHLDIVPGDRQNSCRGVMLPLSLEYNSKKGYQIMHKCSKCNLIRRNKIASDCAQPDNLESLIQLSQLKILL